MTDKEIYECVECGQDFCMNCSKRGECSVCKKPLCDDCSHDDDVCSECKEKKEG